MAVTIVTRFMAEDGTVFDTLGDASRHDIMANLTRRISKDMPIEALEDWLHVNKACQWPKDELQRQMKTEVYGIAKRLSFLQPHQVELLVELANHLRGRK